MKSLATPRATLHQKVIRNEESGATFSFAPTGRLSPPPAALRELQQSEITEYEPR